MRKTKRITERYATYQSNILKRLQEYENYISVDEIRNKFTKIIVWKQANGYRTDRTTLQRLKQLREHKKITVESMAKAIGGTKNTVYHIENGYRTIELDTWAIIADMLELQLMIYGKQ